MATDPAQVKTHPAQFSTPDLAGWMPVAKAVAWYGVPRRTLYDWVKRGAVGSKRGPTTGRRGRSLAVYILMADVRKMMRK